MQPVTAWILFLICTVLTCIVMLNLLIAIISESFAKVNAASELNSLQERARIISENAYLIPTYRKQEISDTSKYILVARDLTDLNINGILDSNEVLE